MTDDFDIIRGTNNVFSDLGHPNAELEHLRAQLAAQIIAALNERKLTVRAAHELTGFAAADFSRVRNARLGRFTVDRLMAMLAGLGRRVEVTVKATKARPANAAAAGHP